MREFGTIRLLGENRIKSFMLGMQILIVCILFFYTLFIHLDFSGNLLLLIPVYIIFFTLFISGIYVMLNTYERLLLGHLTASLFLIVLSVLLYNIFTYIVFKHNTGKMLISFGIYLLAGLLTETLLNKTKYYNFKKRSSKPRTIVYYFIGLGIGKGGYEYVKNKFGRNSSNIMGIYSLLLLALLFGFFGLFYFNKYYIVSKYRSFVYVEYEE